MDCKIHFGLFLVIALLGVCHVADSTSTKTAPAASTPSVTPGPSGTPGPKSSISPTNAPVTTTQTTTTPAPITCPVGTCNSSCSTFNSTGCQSHTNIGCKAEKNKDIYTFSCDANVCQPTDNSVYCCFTNKCNPLLSEPKESKATTMFGNLVSITIIVMLANYV